MNTAFINTVSVRVTATIAIVALLASVVAPIATNAAVVAPATCTVIVSSNVTGDMQTEGAVRTFVHNNWVDENVGDLDGAYWLWSDALVASTTVEETQTFTHDFIWTGTTITNISFQFAADNGYVVELNGTEIGSGSMATDNHSSVTNLSVDPADVDNGDNTLSFEITNQASPDNANPENNPAGFIFKMIIDGTGVNCDEIAPIDVCPNLPDDQATVPVGYVLEAGLCNLIPPVTPDVVSEGEDTPLSCIGENLISNGSFEDPAIGGDWQLVAAVTNWLSSVTEGFEIWKNFNGTGSGLASDGAQNLELDVNTPSTVTQSVDTVAGNVYQVTFDFAPRPGTGLHNNAVEIYADSAFIGNVSADGSDDSDNTWTDHTYSFTAADEITAIDLKDIGTADGLGSLVDNVSVCLVDDNSTPVEPETYEIFGFVYDDTNEDDSYDVEVENSLEGWTVRAVNASNTEQVIIDQSDANGRYSLNVPAGTWIISQETENGWELLSNGNNGDGTYTVTVPVPVLEGVPVDSLVGFLNSILPTAMAAEFDEDAGEFNFGNDEVNRRGGSSSGTRVNRTPTGTVLGSSTSTPTGTILGDATTTMPVGAPNTGAGGTAAVAVNLGGLVAVLTANSAVRKEK